MDAYRVEDNFKNYSIIRPANIYGPYDNFDRKNSMVVPSLIRRALETEDVLEVWGDGSAIRDFVFCEDVARGMLHAVNNKISLPMNIGSGTGISIKELVEVIVKNLPEDKKVKIKWDTSKPSGDKIRVMSMERAKKSGFECKTNLEEGVKKTIHWYLNNKQNLDELKYNSFK